MKDKLHKKTTDELTVNEPATKYGFHHISEDEKLKIDIYRSDAEKLQLFTKMLRRNKLLKTVSIIK
ncbi:MAG: hypothetical protein V9E96_06700 [Chitinophagaceae bacterium]|jgi:hypothetical protein|nr:hypothetical protein [Chitinophagaceae bacterium]MBP9739212.1 hypothetical protein [Chitinophagaceae bacterium]